MDIALGIFFVFVCVVLATWDIGVMLLVSFCWGLLFFMIYRSKYKAEFKKWLEE